MAYTAFAQQSPAPGPQRWRPSTEDIGAFQNARIAALKAGLALTVEQEKLWPPVEAALRENAKKRLARMEKFRAEREARTAAPTAPTPPDAVARLRRGADYLGERSTELKQLADAIQPLYEKLDDAQKRRFQILNRMGMRDRTMRWRDRAEQRDDDRRGRWHQRGPMGPRFGQRDDERGRRFGWRDNREPRDPMGPRTEREQYDGRLGLRFDEPGERL